MPQLPHDLADLALAPLVLAVEDQLESWSGLDEAEMGLRIALETNREPRTADERRAAVLQALFRFVDPRGWQGSWSARGLRLQHELRVVTLGVPPNLRAWLEIA